MKKPSSEKIKRLLATRLRAHRHGNTPGSQENLPINCVDWYVAYAFCIWDGGFLPSEAEWEYAAAGGSQQHLYPWGSTQPGADNQYAIYGCYYPTGSVNCSPADVSNIAPVGYASLGAGYWGPFDLGGDGFEWNLDWEATYVDPCTDCAYLTTAYARINAGGDVWDLAADSTPPDRGSSVPTFPGGFRCARTP